MSIVDPPTPASAGTVSVADLIEAVRNRRLGVRLSEDAPVDATLVNQLLEAFAALDRAPDASNGPADADPASGPETGAQDLAEVAARLKMIAEQFEAESEKLAELSTATSEEAMSAAKSVEENRSDTSAVAQGVLEMKTSIEAIAENAELGSRVSRSAVESSKSAKHFIAKLGDSSHEIGKVVKLISNIASQTNLLALNATIEAARAGDAGRGFAVVATEVKELAKATAAATESIEGLIETIREDARDTAEVIQSISEVIAQFDELTTTIASAVEQQTTTTQSMSLRFEEILASTRSSAERVTSVAENAEETSDIAEASNVLASLIAETACELDEMVTRFQS